MLEIKRLNPGMINPLWSMFLKTAEGNYAQYYYPYDLTLVTAETLCHYYGKDLHYALVDGVAIVGHGMLRGWDEGYDIPSLGIVIHPEVSGMGLGTMFVQFLHSAAWMRGCSKIKLSVHKNNKPAYNLYKKLGYIFTEKNSEELIGIISKTKGIK